MNYLPNRLTCSLMALATLLLLNCTVSLAYEGPVIDMHLHAWPSGEDGGPDKTKNQMAMQDKLASLEEHNVVLAAASGPQAFLEAWGNAAKDRLMLGPIFPCIDGKNPTFYRAQCFNDGANFPDPIWLEEQYQSG
ncbi:hypothetical protein N9985_03240, partial [Gammaproteobacteria bacterium]|nr:hypothetical protein [Gammaproteobacteria bacterium]